MPRPGGWQLLTGICPMEISSFVIQCGSGAAGGALAGTLLKGIGLGPLGDALAGAIGGGIGVQTINSWLGLAAVAPQTGIDLGTLALQLAAGGIGGAVTTALVGLLQRLASR
jgi:hypothetical protein